MRREVNFRLYGVQADLLSTIVELGHAQHHEGGGYSFHFERRDFRGLRSFAFASVTPLRLWEDTGITVLPALMDDVVVYGKTTPWDGHLAFAGARIPAPSDGCEVMDRIFLVLKCGPEMLAKMESSMTGFHSIAGIKRFLCPVQGCTFHATAEGAPLCVVHWPQLTLADRAEFWRAKNSEQSAVLRRVAASSSMAFRDDPAPARRRQPRTS